LSLLIKSALAVFLVGNIATAAHAEVETETSRPTIPVWNAAALMLTCDSGLTKLKQQVAMLEKLPVEQADVNSVFGAWNALQITQDDVEGPVYLLNNVSPDALVRSAADACLLKYNEFSTGLFQNEALYQRVLAVKPVDSVDAKLKKGLLESFEDTGVSLPPEKRARMKEILEQLEMIRQEFERNLRDNKTQLVFTPDELKGLPQDYLEQAKRDDKGNYLLGFNYPEYGPFMENSANEEARRRYQFAFTNRGGTRNIELLNAVGALRHEMAGLFGLPSYAHFATRRRMVGKPEVVEKFLGEVMQAVREIEISDLKDLRQAKAKDLGLPLDKVSLNRWDVAYYQERLKQQRFSIDQEALRRYFPAEATISWVMHISAELYGIEFRRAKVPLWHPDVRYYDVIDTKSGMLLGGIYLDLYPRDGKFTHAAAFGVRGVSMLAGRTPISVLVTNFNRNGLNFGELETLVHEFGHVMHGVLSRTRYAAHAGTSVETDFVEAPSQMYEEWAHKLEAVRLIHDFCKDCPEVDAPMMTRLNAARNFGRGLRYARQHLYASFDMAIYSEQPGEALSVWEKMEAATPLGHVTGTSFPGQFSHIISNYGAGYYGYMWSEVLALDMLSQYGNNLMNPAVGRRFRTEILQRGSEKGGAELVRAFLGREPSPQAFFAEIKGQRQ